MKILQYPHVILSTKTCGLLPEAAPVLAMLPAMEATMRAANGIGLAANQVGIQYRFAIIDIPKDQWTELNSAVEMPLVLINPEIIKREGKVKEVEGCLSIPGYYEPVERSAVVTVKYQDESGQWKELTADGLLSRAIQHECDHLDGKVFLDRLSPLKRGMILKKIQKR